MAQRDKVTEDGRVWVIKNIEIETDYIHPDYTLVPKSEDTIGPTGAWKLFEIEHKASLHRFTARWDEKKSTVDIDMLTASDIRKDFGGHHTAQPNPHQVSFELDIKLGTEEVFRGRVRFNRQRNLTRFVSAKVSAAMSLVTVVRKQSWKNYYRYLASAWHKVISLVSSHRGR